MYPSRFQYEAPRSLEAAIALLRDGGDYAKVLAGGQSLVPLMKLRFASPELIDYLKVAGQPVAGPWPPHQRPRPDPEEDSLPTAVPDPESEP